MQVRVVAFGIAKDILGANTLLVSISPESTVSDLKNFLCENYPAFNKLRSFSIALNTTYADDNAAIQATDEVVIIPPVSGG
ncbi:MAG TPA: MoaD/ThiS family protein [Saprospiraceae bacterium]|nr:MoaD/ThiS family protein [Saprospiraceae bacterium]HMQ82381.1 MoaD/ThiS family protein [Saprospiraceae bacterium]